jgi:hypothetical protein
MLDPTDPRAKAEASLRLAEIAKTPRAKELFRQLAAEYESRAKGELPIVSEAAPPLVPAEVAAPVAVVDAAPAIAPAAPGTPMGETQQWLANLAAVREEP